MPIKKYSYEDKQELLESLNSYIDNTEIPILAEWTTSKRINRSTVYEWGNCKDDLAVDFTDAIKRCTVKKEAELERMALNGEVDRTMAIFSLKQLGWRDKIETENTQKVVFVSEEDADL